MKHSPKHSGNSLFLMEMILVLLFLSLSGAACIRIFAAARENRIQTRQWTQIQALTTSAGEIMEGTEASPEDFVQYMPDGTIEDSSISWYYDTNWNLCDSKNAFYEMELSLSNSENEKSGTLSFYRFRDSRETLYSTDLAFPSETSSPKEAHS